MPQNQVVMIADAPLSQAEVRNLAKLEVVVDRWVQAEYEADIALSEINRQRLYRDYGTFDDYLLARWPDKARSTAYEMVTSGRVYLNVRNSDIPLPANRQQALQLAQLEPPKQIEVLKEARRTAPRGVLTAAHIAKVVEDVTGKPPGAGPGEVSDKMLAAFKALKPKAKAELMQQCKNETMEAARVQKEQPKEEDEPKLHRCPVCKGKGEIGFKVEWSKA